MLRIQVTKYATPTVHVVIWSILMALPAVLLRGVSLNTGLPDHFFLLTNSYHVGLFYLNAYFIYPRLTKRNTIWLYPIALSAIIAGSWYMKLFLLHRADREFHLTSLNRRIIFFAPVPFLIASIIFRFVIDRALTEKRRIQAAAERQRAELKLLRSQVSPHFLFNVLTNLISLARQRSDLLEPSLIRLSELLRYFLYETDEEKCTLQKELGYLQGYIDLMQLRFGETLNLQFENEIRNEDKDRVMEPMLLLPFVENAFKHGIGLVACPFIIINIQFKNDQLSFSVCNNYESGSHSKDKNSGIGLINVKNRLSLLYPGKYTLSIENKNEIYKATLKLDLT